MHQFKLEKTKSKIAKKMSKNISGKIVEKKEILKYFLRRLWLLIFSWGINFFYKSKLFDLIFMYFLHKILMWSLLIKVKLSKCHFIWLSLFFKDVALNVN